MKKYRAEAMRFAGQVMLATGYFNTRLPTEQPKTEINYTDCDCRTATVSCSILSLTVAVTEYAAVTCNG